MCSGSYSFTVGVDSDGMSARNFLRRICGLTARSMTVLKYAEGGITRSGELLRSCDTVHTGDVIDLRLPADVNDITPVEGELKILFEDDHILVADKPPYMPVHPVKVHQLDTLANIVSYHQAQRGERYAFRALNRIDKDTSGCVIIAKDRLCYAMTLPTVRKEYLAVCEGIINKEGVIDAPIALEPGSKIKRCVCEGGQRAVTHYAPINHSVGYTVLRVRLETGRTHQIRCHMSSIGHPLAGDDLYGGSRERISRQALHCMSVSFIHPVSRDEIRLTADIPSDMAALTDMSALI